MNFMKCFAARSVSVCLPESGGEPLASNLALRARPASPGMGKVLSKIYLAEDTGKIRLSCSLLLL